MFDHRHYVPILKAKLGELTALPVLDADVKAALTPLIEVPEIDWDYDEDAPAKTMDAHLQKLPAKLADAWPGGRPFFLDMPWWEVADGNMASGTHPLEHLAAQCAARNVPVIPVTGPGRPATYTDAAHAAATLHQRGLCLRVQQDDFETFLANPSAVLDGLRRTLPFADVDLIIDMGAVTQANLTTARIGARAVIAAIPHVASWRTLTFASSAFPKNLSDFSVGFGFAPRADYELWQMINATPQLARRPTFGDYAIQAPELADVDPRVMQMSASIRYATDAAWLIVKGRNVRKYTFEEFRRIALQLLSRPEFKGQHFSFGDGYITGCAAGTEGAGNATTWRRVGTNHHLTFVVRQLAAPAAAAANQGAGV